MSDLFEYFKHVYTVFWGNDIFYVWFYISILVILIWGSKSVKRTFAVYPLCLLLALFNPITYYVSKVFTGGAWQYYARMYSMLPIPITIGIGSLLLLEFACLMVQKRFTSKKSNELNKRENTSIQVCRLVKFNYILMLCVAMVFGGTSVYTQDWMKEANNLLKVPSETIEICKQVHSDESDIMIAVPNSLSTYIRQVDASLYTPYGRYLNTLGYELSKEHPDPEFTMIEAGKNGCDYVVIYDNDENQNAFNAHDYHPFSSVGSYLIYRVEGIPKVKKYYDEKHQIIKVSHLDSNGNQEKQSEGYYSISYEYDYIGNLIRENYLDENGEKIILEKGYCTINRSYTQFSRQIASIYYTNQNDEKVLVNGRYETRNEYNNKRKMIRESYYDSTGNPMIRTDTLYASCGVQYNESGGSTAIRYYNLEGKLTLSSDGSAGYDQVLDNNNRVISVRFIDENENLTINKSGIAIFNKEYDGNGNIVREYYEGINGELILCRTGYAELRREYDSHNRIIKETYWDEVGNPASIKNGYCGVAREWDEAGNIVAEIYLSIE